MPKGRSWGQETEEGEGVSQGRRAGETHFSRPKTRNNGAQDGAIFIPFRVVQWGGKETRRTPAIHTSQKTSYPGRCTWDPQWHGLGRWMHGRAGQQAGPISTVNHPGRAVCLIQEGRRGQRTALHAHFPSHPRHGIAWELQTKEKPAVVAQSDRTNTVSPRWDTGGATQERGMAQADRPQLGAAVAVAVATKHRTASHRNRIAPTGDATHRVQSVLDSWCTRDKLKVCPGCAPPRVPRGCSEVCGRV